VLILLLVPLLLTLGRLSGLPGAGRLSEILDLSTLPPPLRAHVHQVLFVPVGALVVVIGRLVLGLRPLGVLSPILLAMALPVTGVLPGVGFVGFTLLLTTVFVRPLLKSRGLPYSARVATLLSCVAIFMLLPLVALRGVSDAAAEFAFFPVVALGLVTERFAATLRSEGTAVAATRTAVSLGEAVVIATVATHGGANLLLHRPELLLAQMALMILISQHMSWKLWERRRSGYANATPSRTGRHVAPSPPGQRPATWKGTTTR
jgi:hypothetical protein